MDAAQIIGVTLACLSCYGIGVLAGVRKASQPKNIVLVMKHAITCKNCAPKFIKAMDAAGMRPHVQHLTVEELREEQRAKVHTDAQK